MQKRGYFNGAFAKEFTSLDKAGPGIQKKLERLYEKANQSELAKGEARVRERLELKTIQSTVSLTDKVDLCKHPTE